MAIAFRRCDAGDVELLLDRLNEWLGPDQRLDRSAVRRSLSALLQTPARGTIWLVHNGAMAIGYAMIAPRTRFADHHVTLVMAGLYLTPSYRGRGIGPRAFQLMDAMGRRAGIPVARPGGRQTSEDHHAPGLVVGRGRGAWRTPFERKAVA